MPNPNSYECKACGATFDSKDKLDTHNRREHSSGATAGTGAGSSRSQGQGQTTGQGQSKGTGRESGVGTGSGTGGTTPSKKNM